MEFVLYGFIKGLCNLYFRIIVYTARVVYVRDFLIDRLSLDRISRMRSSSSSKSLNRGVSSVLQQSRFHLSQRALL